MKPNSNHPSEPVVDRSISEDYYNSGMYVKMAHVVTNRAYWSFSIMVIVCVMTGVVLFNHYWSYEEDMYRKMNIFLRLDSTQTKAIDNTDTITFGIIKRNELIKGLQTKSILPIDSLGIINGENPISKRIRENYIDNHIESAYISIPLLGIKVSVNDILIVMSVTFLILSGWLFFCIRAENFTIGKILSLNQAKRIDIRRRIFYDICFNNMLFPTTQRKKAYSDLSNIAKSLREELKDIPIKTRRRKWRNDAVCLIFFIPFAIMSFNLLSHYIDISNILSSDKEYKTIEYKTKGQTKIFYIDDSKTARMDFNDVNITTENPYNTYLYWILGISTCCVIALFFPCRATYRCQKGTSRVLYHFKQRFKHDDDCQKLIDYYKLGESKATIQVVTMNSKAIFSNKQQYDKYKEDVAQAYSMENGFYFLTHSGDWNEVNRLKAELSKNYNYDNNSPDIHFGEATEKKEYFIFLKKHGEEINNNVNI
jgi:hypothetical protein